MIRNSAVILLVAVLAGCGSGAFPGGLFPAGGSATTVWPQYSLTFWVMTRPMMSVALPAGNAMITRTGFVGKGCAVEAPWA